MSYLTTYRQSYTKKPISYVETSRCKYEEFDELPEGGNWMSTKMDVNVALHKIHEMYAKRYVSVYGQDYPWKTASMQMTSVTACDDVDDQLLKTCEHIRSKPKDLQLLPPLKGARMVFGYMNPKYFHTGNSSYELDYGLHACKLIYGKDLEKHRSTFDIKPRKEMDNTAISKENSTVVEEENGKANM